MRQVFFKCILGIPFLFTCSRTKSLHDEGLLKLKDAKNKMESLDLDEILINTDWCVRDLALPYLRPRARSIDALASMLRCGELMVIPSAPF